MGATEWIQAKRTTLEGWFATIWLTIAGVRFIQTAVASIRHPFNPGFDQLWMNAIIGSILVVCLSHILLPAQKANRLWAILIAGSGACIIVLSGTAPASLAAGALLLVAVGLGHQALRVLRTGSINGLDRFIVSAALGAGTLAFVPFILGLAGRLTPLTAWISLSAIGACALASMIRTGFREWPNPVVAGEQFDKHESGILFTLCGFVFLLNLCWTVAPEIQFDALNYHLGVPRLFMDQQRIVDLSYFFHSYFAHLMDFDFLFAMLLSSAAAAKFFNLAMSAMAFGAVYALGRYAFGKRAGLWAAVLFYTTPLTSWLSGTTYIDVTIGGYVAALALAVLHWHRTRKTGWLAVTGLLGGFAIGAKLTAAYPMAGLTAVIGWQLFRHYSPGQAFRRFAIFVLAVIVVSAPWYLLVYHFTGNPVFPIYNGIFKSPHWDPVNPQFSYELFGTGTTLGALLRLPFRLSLNGERFGDALTRPSLGFSMLAALPLLLLIWVDSFAALALFITAATFMIFWASLQYGRYYISILPLISILSMACIFRGAALHHNLRRVVLFAVVVMQAAAIPVLFWNIPDRIPVTFALGRESKQEFLERSLSGYAGAEYLNTTTHSEDRVLGLGVEPLRFYLNAPLDTQAEALLDSPIKKMLQLESPEEIAQKLAELHIAYLLAAHDTLKTEGPMYRYFSPEFISIYGRKEFEDKEAVVYRLCAHACSSGY